jgi:hypothetical protein
MDYSNYNNKTVLVTGGAVRGEATLPENYPIMLKR